MFTLTYKKYIASLKTNLNNPAVKSIIDIPTDITTTKTLSGSYQPHGSPLTNGTVSSSSTFIADGFTNAPNVGETFQFGGTGTVYTINSVTATGVSGEYVISIPSAVSQADGVTLQFVTSKVFNGLNMFIYQGQKAFYLWNKINPEIDEELIELLLSKLK